MQPTPNQAYEQAKESLVQYLETAYRISHPDVFAERGAMLRRRGIVAQVPFIESTPAFETDQKLAELERQHREVIPSGLAELVQHGVPVDRFPLYRHQQEALIKAFGAEPNLLVATGTGSGKTEAFLLPILADILREAAGWESPVHPLLPGEYDAEADVWRHARRYERRPAGIRGIILYPMNALVNDQLSRLRRILARGASPDWQRRNLNGNVIHFGMYTGLSRPTGSWKEKWRREAFESYMEELRQEWERLNSKLQNTGNWPRPDSPEMLCRWDIQAAPPDILVTNYSMLEYMMVRPIEHPIFEITREWLHADPAARITLVLDEAHTYTGAKGTEVAHLIRRLKERLDLSSGSSKFRAIATSASIPDVGGADGRVKQFASSLFGEPEARFSLVKLKGQAPTGEPRVSTEETLSTFSQFFEAFDPQEPFPAIEQLAKRLGRGRVDRTTDPSVELYRLLETNEDVLWVRRRTARNATPLTTVAEECWGETGSREAREKATAGILAAGSFARASELPDTPPLLSMRLHSFFRGVTGFWACMNPGCSELDSRFSGNGTRPVGKIYTEARPWCDCGARVLELFSCRRCGLLFLGGIPDEDVGSLWPWSDDLSGELQDVKEYRIFGVERPHVEAPEVHRSTRSTLHTHSEEPYARPVYEIEAATEEDVEVSPFPTRCPRCQNYRAPGPDGREVIEPLRTKGPQSFAVVIEENFRAQPRSSEGIAPNHGRKGLLFSDSRQEASMLAADLRTLHRGDLFRQLLYRVLHSCRTCNGKGVVETTGAYVIGQEQTTSLEKCAACAGTGLAVDPQHLAFQDLRRQVLELQFAHGIDPTGGEVPNFFRELESGNTTAYSRAEVAFNVALRRELSEDRFSLEPLGLASWKVRLPATTGAFAPLTESETQCFLRAVARILATENALLPPEPLKPWEWPESVEPYERLVVIPAFAKQGLQIVPYNLEHYRKLGRYVIALSGALIEEGRLPDPDSAQKWVKELYWPLWNALKGINVLQWAGAKVNDQVPYGVRIDSFELHPVADAVQRCEACAYVVSEALLHVCARCGARTCAIPPQEVRDYYRRSAGYALPDSPFDDPYPLRTGEHTAQITTQEARDQERWFQDLFHQDEVTMDRRVDVLSVTTTMEMGIDIGSLLAVGLRNVPPTVANYQQRAGRAGRRGSAVAMVTTFAQQRSHDQYYFDRPPEIVSDPPNVPSLYVDNEVIGRRHVRSLVLQAFFYGRFRQTAGSGLFSTWGTVGSFARRGTADQLQAYVSANQATLISRAKEITEPQLHSHLPSWFAELRAEVQRVVDGSPPEDPLFERLIGSGLLPKYAFPVDVVSLNVPKDALSPPDEDAGGRYYSDSMQRDLKIALSEYAPGAEVIRQAGQETYKFPVVGVYDPYDTRPDYRPTGVMVECRDCQAVVVIGLEEDPGETCAECGSFNVITLPYLRPPGFTVDAALPSAGAELYRGGGRERSGYTMPARLLVGQSALAGGTQRSPFAPALYTSVRRGELFTCNKGPDRQFPGFLICPTCGRSLDPDDPIAHRYPADVPPHYRGNRGPRAGEWCPNRDNFTNQVILGYQFFSECLLLGVDLPASLDAPFMEPSGKAIWYSFGTLLTTASTVALQIDPGELSVGVRPVQRSPGRLHGEVFLYDDVPGGAGYARGIDEDLEPILRKALELARHCSNPDCSGACYHCLFDYRNQNLHPLLDRGLGAAVLEFLLDGTTPTVDRRTEDECGLALAEYARAAWSVDLGVEIRGHYFPCVLESDHGEKFGLQVTHPLSARPSSEERSAIQADTGLRPAVHTSFDLQRRPFWVLNNLLPT